MIKREVIVHAQIRHQNVIQLLGIWQDSEGGPPLMVMPFAENGSASAYLRRNDVGTTHCAKIVRTCFSHRNTRT